MYLMWRGVEYKGLPQAAVLKEGLAARYDWLAWWLSARRSVLNVRRTKSTGSLTWKQGSACKQDTHFFSPVRDHGFWMLGYCKHRRREPRSFPFPAFSSSAQEVTPLISDNHTACEHLRGICGRRCLLAVNPKAVQNPKLYGWHLYINASTNGCSRSKRHRPSASTCDIDVMRTTSYPNPTSNYTSSVLNPEK